MLSLPRSFVTDVKNIYRLSLALPLVRPALAGVVLWLFPGMEPGAQILLMFVAGSGLIGGPPYMVLAGIFFVWMRNKDEAAIRRALLLSPLLLIGSFAAIGMMYLAGMVLVGERLNPADLDADFIIGPLQIAAFSLLFGYGYVLVVFGLVAVLRRSLGVDP